MQCDQDVLLEPQAGRLGHPLQLVGDDRALGADHPVARGGVAEELLLRGQRALEGPIDLAVEELADLVPEPPPVSADRAGTGEMQASALRPAMPRRRTSRRVITWGLLGHWPCERSSDRTSGGQMDADATGSFKLTLRLPSV